MDPPIFFFQDALRGYDTICLLSVFPCFFSVTFFLLLHVISDPVFPTYRA